MAKSIYATFNTEEDAERATGALLDHGVAAEAVSFVISDPLLHPTVFHPEARASAPPSVPAANVDAVPPPHAPLPGTYVTPPGGAVATPAPVYDARSTAAAVPVAEPATSSEWDARSPVSAAVLPPNTPQDVVEHEKRPHIIDMESDRPQAADGISTTTAGDAAKGAAGGAGLGIGLGILLGIAAVIIPGVGLVAGSAALVAGLAAATGVAGGIAGGVYGYLADLGIPPNSARLLSDQLKSGGVLLHVDVTGSVSDDEIVRILAKYGATSAQAF